MKCIVCDSEFDGRADAKYCSDKCRVTDNRKRNKSVTDNSAKVVTDKKKVEVMTLSDFGVDLKDLGVKFAPSGGPIFLRNDITAEQVFSLVRVTKAMKGEKLEGYRETRDREFMSEQI